MSHSNIHQNFNHESLSSNQLSLRIVWHVFISDRVGIPWEHRLMSIWEGKLPAPVSIPGLILIASTRCRLPGSWKLNVRQAGEVGSSVERKKKRNASRVRGNRDPRHVGKEWVCNQPSRREQVTKVTRAMRCVLIRVSILSHGLYSSIFLLN